MAELIYSILPQPRRPIVYVHSKVTLAECIKMMTEQDIGALVVQDGGALIGMVTERDIVRSSMRYDLDLQKSTAGDIAFTDVSVLELFDPVEKVMKVMTQTKRRHVLVSENGEIIALLSIGDVLFYLLEEKTRVIEHLEKYIHS